MIKKITTLVNENRNAVIKKSLIFGGAVLGLVAGAMLARPDVVVEGEVVETVEEETTTV